VQRAGGCGAHGALSTAEGCWKIGRRVYKAQTRWQRVARAKLVAASSLMAALVFVVTASFSLYIPETRGYFNFGEAAVYASAFVLPPPWAAFAGGVGSMLADVALGYYHYAPATLAIKACEAYVASLLLRRRPRAASRAAGFAASLAPPALLAALGAAFYTGRAEATLALPASPLAATLTWEMSVAAWLAAAAALAAYSAYASLKRPEAGWAAAALAASGLVMVTGYFLYEQLILGVAALAEVPFNFMQVLVGVSAALLAERRLSQLAVDAAKGR
jgi:hypothetical protein